MKKISKALVAGAALLACAGTAQAADSDADININVAGASAQFLFWVDAADDFLRNIEGCDPATVVTKVEASGGDVSKSKQGYTYGENCANRGGKSIIIRYSSKASYDGIRAQKGIANTDDSYGAITYDAANNNATVINGGVKQTCADPTQRPLADKTDSATITNLRCQTVNVGASDVAADMFTQSSLGFKLKGPVAKTTDSTTSRSNLAITDLTGVKAKTPVIVPFAFFANKGVKWYRCAGDNAKPFCTPATQATDCTGGDTCQYTTIDNITRPMAVNIFSKQATNWSEFGGYFEPKPIVACLRAAGSGTAAAFDHTIMRSVWGKALQPSPKTVTAYPPTANAYWFNDSSTDQMNCIDGQINNPATNTNLGSRGDIGAIGYADADQSNKTNTVRLKYNGVEPSRQAIRNGWYDYFSNQQLYYIEADYNATKDTTPSTISGGVFVHGSGNGTFGGVLDDLNNFASIPGNIPTTKAQFWATDGEMRWNRSSDKAYPVTKITSPTAPQTP